MRSEVRLLWSGASSDGRDRRSAIREISSGTDRPSHRPQPLGLDPCANRREQLKVMRPADDQPSTRLPEGALGPDEAGSQTPEAHLPRGDARAVEAVPGDERRPAPESD